MLAARSMWICSRSGLRRPRRTAKELGKAPVGHGQPLAVVEIIHVEPDAAVRFKIDEMLEDQIAIDRFAIGGEPHQLVFAAVDLEAAVVGERRVEQSEGVGKLEVMSQSQFVAGRLSEAGGAPLADAVHR